MKNWKIEQLKLKSHIIENEQTLYNESLEIPLEEASLEEASLEEASIDDTTCE